MTNNSLVPTYILIAHDHLVGFQGLKSIAVVETLKDNGLKSSHHLALKFTKLVTYFPETVKGFVSDMNKRFPGLTCFEATWEYYNRRYEMVGVKPS